MKNDSHFHSVLNGRVLGIRMLVNKTTFLYLCVSVIALLFSGCANPEAKQATQDLINGLEIGMSKSEVNRLWESIYGVEPYSGITSAGMLVYYCEKVNACTPDDLVSRMHYIHHGQKASGKGNKQKIYELPYKDIYPDEHRASRYIVFEESYEVVNFSIGTVEQIISIFFDNEDKVIGWISSGDSPVRKTQRD